MALSADRRGFSTRVFSFLATTIAPPAIVFLIARTVLSGIAVSAGYDPFQSRIWHRWDSIHYLAIARKGYEFYPCDGTYGYSPDQWCGNTGWFPGYPWLIRALARLGLEEDAAGAFLSGVFHFLTLLVLWKGPLESQATTRSAIVLLSAGFFPGFVYYHAIFPVSMFTFFAVACLYLVSCNRLVWGSIAGACGALSYATGVLLAPVVALWIFTRPTPDDQVRRQVLRGLSAAGAILMGFATVLTVHYLTVGRWDAFFQVQAKYGHDLSNPLRSFFLATIDPLVQAGFHRNWNRGLHVYPPIQTLLVTTLLLTVVGSSLRRRRTMPPMDSLALVYVVVYWLFPLLMGHGVSLYRAESLLLPLVVLTKTFPKWAGCLLVAGLILEGWAMALLFYRGVLM